MLASPATAAQLDSDPTEIVAAPRSIYSRLPASGTRLRLGFKDGDKVRPVAVAAALAKEGRIPITPVPPPRIGEEPGREQGVGKVLAGGHLTDLRQPM